MDLGRYICVECGIHMRRSKIQWLRHTKAEHETEWQILVSLQLGSPAEVDLLDEALTTINDEDDYDARIILEICHWEGGEGERTRRKRNPTSSSPALYGLKPKVSKEMPLQSINTRVKHLYSCT